MQNGQSYKRHKMIKEKDKNSRNETNVENNPKTAKNLMEKTQQK